MQPAPASGLASAVDDTVAVARLSPVSPAPRNAPCKEAAWARKDGGFWADLRRFALSCLAAFRTEVAAENTGREFLGIWVRRSKRSSGGIGPILRRFHGRCWSSSMC